MVQFKSFHYYCKVIYFISKEKERLKFSCHRLIFSWSCRTIEKSGVVRQLCLLQASLKFCILPLRSHMASLMNGNTWWTNFYFLKMHSDKLHHGPGIYPKILTWSLLFQKKINPWNNTFYKHVYFRRMLFQCKLLWGFWGKWDRKQFWQFKVRQK